MDHFKWVTWNKLVHFSPLWLCISPLISFTLGSDLLSDSLCRVAKLRAERICSFPLAISINHTLIFFVCCVVHIMYRVCLRRRRACAMHQVCVVVLFCSLKAWLKADFFLLVVNSAAFRLHNKKMRALVCSRITPIF